MWTNDEFMFGQKWRDKALLFCRSVEGIRRTTTLFAFDYIVGALEKSLCHVTLYFVVEKYLDSEVPLPLYVSYYILSLRMLLSS